MDEELLTRQPPQSLEAEQAVLGSILIDSRCLTEVVGLVKPEDFYLQQNREIYETIYTMFNFSQTIDPVTVLDKLKELGYYHDNSRDYILQLMEITPTAANVVRYASIVRDKAMLRGLNQAATDIHEMVSDEAYWNISFLCAVNDRFDTVNASDISRIDSNLVCAIFHGRNCHFIIKMNIRYQWNMNLLFNFF